jgi:hypothetical protein
MPDDMSFGQLVLHLWGECVRWHRSRRRKPKGIYYLP